MTHSVISARSPKLPVVVMAIFALLQARPDLPQASGEDQPKTPEVPFRHVIVDAAGPATPWLKTAGDLNGDGRVDLIVGGHSAGGLVWYENPTWKKHVIDPEGRFSTDAEVVDVDQHEALATAKHRVDGVISY